MRRLVLIANLIASLAIAVVITVQVLGDRDGIVADARSDVKIVRDAMSEHARQTLAAVSLSLSSIAEDIDSTRLGSAETHRMLVTRQETLAPTFAMFMLDEDGYLAATSRTQTPEPVDFSAETMFTAHRDDPSRGLVITPPRKGRVGYAEDRWMVAVSRRLNHPDGSFAGIVAAAMSLRYLNEIYDALRMGQDGVVGLSKDDGTVLTRSPFNEDVVGRVLTDTKLYRELLPAADRGVYRAEFVTDGVDRIIAYGRVPDFPVVVYAGVSVGERLAGWRQRALIDAVIGLFAILVMGSFSIVLLRRLDERQREQETRVGQLRKLTEISTAVLESPDVATALQRATEMARDLVPCHQVATSLTEDSSMAQAIQTVSLSGKYAAWRDYDEQPDGSGIYREVCETNKPMRLTQAELERHPDWMGFGAASDQHPPMRGWLAVPLMDAEGKNLGLVQLSDRESGEFTAEDEALMVELAHATSVAIQKLKMADGLRKAATTAERHRSEAEKARSEIESILTSIRDAVYALDNEWRFTFLNPRAEEYLERKTEDLIGRSIWEEFPETEGTILDKEYHRARDENLDVEFQFYYPPLQRWFEVRAFPQDGGGLTVYFQDVSNYVAQEEQLRQAQKMEAVGQLTGGVAHDFNNLLTVILGNAEVVLDSLDKDDPNHRLVSIIENTAERGGELTQRLLAFSRRQPLDPKAVDVNALLGELEPLLARTLGEQYEIRFFREDGIAKAVVDPGQLQNAIVNLAINARDAMPGGGDLTIETAEVRLDGEYVDTHIEAAPGHYVVIAVGDNGVGMSPEVRSRVFEPFFTTKEVGAGTGLGLSMVYGFIRQSNGHINIYSEPGEGTTVKLYLPCTRNWEPVEPDAGASDAGRRGSERILVVEDDMLVREITISALTSLGYDVKAVADGPAALAVLEDDGNFDLLLCDVILGSGMNGREVAEAAQEILPGLKVLYMSGYTENAIFHHGRLDAGARLLMKPFRRDDLAKKVREALDD